MICYLPFAHIPANPFEDLAQAMGPITVYLSGLSMVTESLGRWQQQGLMDIRTSDGVDEGRLLSRLQEIKSWAQLHDGHIGDMIHFYNTNPGHPPMIDEGAPSQIRNQIRNFGKSSDGDEAEKLLQAALFLALAQEYDQHQERLGSDLKAVAGMEKAMFASIGGADEGTFTMGNHATGTGGAPIAEDVGAHMTRLRLQAWVKLALSDTWQSIAYVTPSAAVFDYLKGLASKVVDLPTWILNRSGDDSELKQHRRAALKRMSTAAQLQVLELDPDLCGQPAADALALEWFGADGCLFETLLPDQSTRGRCNNTIVGLLRPAK